MGELKTGGVDAKFRSLLGSCIGLVLYDANANVGGLAHIMLPSSVGHDGPPGKFADTAIAEMISQLETAGGRPSRLNAKIVGGARMFESSAESTIGDQNAVAVSRALNDYGIPILGSECGGSSGRRIEFTVATGRVVIEAVGCEPKTI